MSLKGYFCFVLIAAWNISSWTFLINVPYNVSKKKKDGKKSQS